MRIDHLVVIFIEHRIFIIKRKIMNHPYFVHLLQEVSELSFVQFVDLICNVIIALFAGFGIYAGFTYRFLKRDTLEKAKREKLLFSLDMAKNFAKNVNYIIQRLESIKEFLGRKNQKIIKSYEDLTELEKDFLANLENSDSNFEIHNILNELETIAILIFNNLADEKLVFNQIGKLYCENIKMLSPVIFMYLPDGDFLEILRLYEFWVEKVEKIKLNNHSKLQEIIKRIR